MDMNGDSWIQKQECMHSDRSHSLLGYEFFLQILGLRFCPQKQPWSSTYHPADNPPKGGISLHHPPEGCENSILIFHV